MGAGMVLALLHVRRGPVDMVLLLARYVTQPSPAAAARARANSVAIGATAAVARQRCSTPRARRLVRLPSGPGTFACARQRRMSRDTPGPGHSQCVPRVASCT